MGPSKIGKDWGSSVFNSIGLQYKFSAANIDPIESNLYLFHLINQIFSHLVLESHVGIGPRRISPRRIQLSVVTESILSRTLALSHTFSNSGALLYIFKLWRPLGHRLWRSVIHSKLWCPLRYPQLLSLSITVPASHGSSASQFSH